MTTETTSTTAAPADTGATSSTADAGKSDGAPLSDAAAGDASKDAGPALDAGPASDAGSGADAGPATGYGGAPIPLDAFAATLAAEMCKVNATSCPPALKLPYATQAGCEASLKAADAKDFEDLAKLVAAGTMTYDPVKAGECLAQASAVCKAVDFVDGSPACQAVFKGTLKPGESCQFNVMCASNFCFGNEIGRAHV
mgnify:CR=1 FL=1